MEVGTHGKVLWERTCIEAFVRFGGPRTAGIATWRILPARHPGRGHVGRSGTVRASEEHAGPVLTRKQLAEQLHRQSIPTVPGSALTGYLNSLHALPGFESHAPEPFSRDPGGTPLTRSGWRGALGEVSAQRSGVVPQRNLNEFQHNHPIFDLRDYKGGLNSVKTSVRSANARADPFGTYLQGMKDMVGLRPGTYARAREALYPSLSAAEGEALMLRNGYLCVNEDHVEPFRAALLDPENYRRQSYRQIADRFLEMEPVRIAGTVHLRYQTLENTLRGTGTSASVRQQVETCLLRSSGGGHFQNCSWWRSMEAASEGTQRRRESREDGGRRRGCRVIACRSWSPPLRNGSDRIARGSVEDHDRGWSRRLHRRSRPEFCHGQRGTVRGPRPSPARDGLTIGDRYGPWTWWPCRRWTCCPRFLDDSPCSRR